MSTTRARATFALAMALLGAASAGSAQLRPLEPVAWEVFDPAASLSVSAGFGLLQDQRASLAGTEGRLLELGNFQATWRSGRIAVEAAGTVLRVFDDRDAFAPPFGDARDEHGPRRVDSGDYRLSTAVLLTPPGRPTAAILRFGARLPTTNNRVGLDRDQTDFFGLAGGRATVGGVRLTGETGVGIYGTRYPDFEQSDLWIYAARGELPGRRIVPSLALLGQVDLSAGDPLRGNEDLVELRAGVRVGGSRRLEVQVVHGLTAFSPSAGLLIQASYAR